MTGEKSLLLGIVGSGQLAQMLCQSLRKKGVQSAILAQSEKDPAVHHADRIFLKGTEQESRFFNQIDALTFENEFDPIEEYAQKYSQQFSNLKIFPCPDIILKLRNKFFQKELFQTLSLRSPAFKKVSREDMPDAHVKCVYKWALGGYDGYGNFFWDPQKKDCSGWKDFMDKAQKKGVQVFKEDYCSFEGEWALQASFIEGEIQLFFPLIQTYQEKGCCRWAYKACRDKLSVYEEEACLFLKSFAKELKYTGLLAMEFFEVEGQLWVNEVAPRVHNSAHYSLDAFKISQFDAHNYAVLGAKLPMQEEIHSRVLMYNLLGAEEVSVDRLKVEAFRERLDSSMKLYWYEKTQIKPGRKMGHINVVLNSEEDYRELLPSLRLLEKELWESMKL